MKETVGIVGYGRLGHALAQKLVNRFHVMASSLLLTGQQEEGVVLAENHTIFSESNYIILCVNPEDMESVISRYIGLCRQGACIINTATGFPTQDLESLAREVPGLRVIGAKLMGQYLAIRNGHRIAVVTGSPRREDWDTLRHLFQPFAEISTGNEEQVRWFNQSITKMALKLLLAAQAQWQGSGLPDTLIETGAKAVAIGTIEEYKKETDNSYLKQLLRELNGGYTL